MDITGAVALVTGGASGLGGATASRLAANGAKVLVVDINEATGAAKAEELGGDSAFAKCDVTDPAEWDGALAAASELGPLRIIVNAAGTGSATRTIDREGNPHPVEIFDFVSNINVRGTFLGLTKGASVIAKTDPVNDEGERGVIVNTASVAAFDGQIGQLVYAATKGAVVSMALPAARDLSVVGIRVMTIAPGVMDTPLLGLLPQDKKDALAANVPFPKRLGAPDEFAKLVQQIAENSYLNAQCIRLDGALRMPPKG